MNTSAAPTTGVKPPAAPPFFESGLWNKSWFMALLCLAFVGLDWELVPLVVFPFVFIFPVMLVAWNRSLSLTLPCVGVLSLARILHQLALFNASVTAGELADALICFFVLLLLATLTTLLSRQSRQLRQRVQQLEGILPICAGCKAIRDEQGNWTQLEGYITKHTPAQFSHSFCPDCYKAFYGDLPPGAAQK